MSIVEEDRKNNKIKGNLAGYAVKAIKNDYRKDRKPSGRKISVYEGMRIIYKGNEYIIDAGLSIRFDNGSVMAVGSIIEKIKSGAMRVIELMLFPGIKILVDGQVHTLRNSYGEAVVKEKDLFISEKEIITGIKNRKYTIIEYPDLEINDTV